MTPLRRRMLEDMQIRNFSKNTQETYLIQVACFARHFNKSPELLGPEQIRAYQIYLTNDKRLCASSIGIATSALRFLYLMHHPHLHCVVPGGGLSFDGQRWVACRRGFFLPVRVLSRFFRARFLQLLQQAYERGQLQFFSSLQSLCEREAFCQYLEPLQHTEWVVYAKAPLAGPQQVLDYLGRL